MFWYTNLNLKNVVPGHISELSLHAIKISKVAWHCLILFEVPSFSLFQSDKNTNQHHAENCSQCVYSLDLSLEPTGIWWHHDVLKIHRLALITNGVFLFCNIQNPNFLNWSYYFIMYCVCVIYYKM